VLVLPTLNVTGEQFAIQLVDSFTMVFGVAVAVATG
jgi:hypothetical protein